MDSNEGGGGSSGDGVQGGRGKGDRGRDGEWRRGRACCRGLQTVHRSIAARQRGAVEWSRRQAAVRDKHHGSGSSGSAGRRRKGASIFPIFALSLPARSVSAPRRSTRLFRARHATKNSRHQNATRERHAVEVMPAAPARLRRVIERKGPRRCPRPANHGGAQRPPAVPTPGRSRQPLPRHGGALRHGRQKVRMCGTTREKETVRRGSFAQPDGN